MSPWPKVTRACRALFRKELVEEELDEELRGYFEDAVAARMRAGMGEADARRRTRLEMGSLDGLKEKVRAVGWETAVETLWRDLRFGLRMLRKTPGFTAVAVLALALGIGVNVAIFSVVSALLLRPLPVKDPDRLTVLAFHRHHGPLQDNFSYALLADVGDRARSAFSGVMGFQQGLDGVSAGGGSGGRVDRLLTAYVTGNYFTVLGIAPAVGRLIAPAEGVTPGSDPVIVLGHSYWKSRFAGDPGAVGRKVLVNGHPVTVIGVAPEGFRGARALQDTQAWLPLAMAIPLEQFGGDFLVNRGIRNLLVVARLNPGIGLREAQATLKVVAARLSRRYPETDGGISLAVYPELAARPRPQSSGPATAVARLFLLLAALVLLLACVDVANLLLVRATVRQREMILRAALGASRRRLIRQLLAESLLLATLGGIAALLLAAWCRGALGAIHLPAADAPLPLDLAFDWRVFAYAAGAALLTGALAGTAPALRAVSGDLTAALRGGGRGVAAGRHHLRDGLVVVQVAASLMLLIVAGLFTISLESARRLSLGFDPDPVLNFTIDPGAVGIAERQGRQIYQELLTRVRTLPGVESASLAAAVPMGDNYFENTLLIPGYVRPPGEPWPLVDYNVVSPGYFETMGIPMIAGRALGEADGREAQLVAVVNRAMAERFWPRADPLGRRFAMASHPESVFQVVGVARDSRNVGTEGAVEPFFYVPLAQRYTALRVLQVHTFRPRQMMIPAVRKAVAGLAPGVPVFDVGPMRSALGGMRGFLMFQVGAGLAAAMGTLGLLLALFGVYGVVSYSASQRRKEIGVRMALGADRAAIVKMILRHGLGIVGLGLAAGDLASYGVARLMGGFLLGVGPADPPTYLGVTAALALAALAACYLPARRVTAADPTRVLRCD